MAQKGSEYIRSIDDLPEFMRPVSINNLAIPEEIRPKVNRFVTDIINEYRQNLISVLFHIPPKPKGGQQIVTLILDDSMLEMPKDQLSEQLSSILHGHLGEDVDIGIDITYLTDIWRDIQQQTPDIDKYFSSKKVLFDRVFYLPLAQLYANRVINGIYPRLDKFRANLNQFRSQGEIKNLTTPELQPIFTNYLKLENLQPPILTTDRYHQVETFTLSIANEFKEQFISLVVWGGALKPNPRPGTDVDCAVILGDSLNNNVSSAFDSIRRRVYELGSASGADLHIQCYPNLYFMAGLAQGDPVIINVLVNGVPAYDRGCFFAMQNVQKRNPEGNQLQALDFLYKTSENQYKKLNDEILEDALRTLELMVVCMSQAILVELGYLPPAPRDVSNQIIEKLVKQREWLNEDDVSGLPDIIGSYKQIRKPTGRKPTFQDLARFELFAQQYRVKLQSIVESLHNKTLKDDLYMFVEWIDNVGGEKS